MYIKGNNKPLLLYIIKINLLLFFISFYTYPQNNEWVNYGPPGIVNDIEINPKDSNEWFISTYKSGFFKTTDAGKSWNFASNGIPVGEPYFSYYYIPVKYDPLDPQVIYAGTGSDQTSCGEGLFKSTDGGNSWVRLKSKDFSPASVREIEVNPQNTSQVFISEYHCNYGGGLYRSDDYGLTWKQLLNVYGPGPIVFDTTNGMVIYTIDRYGSFWKSTNYGDSWDTLITAHRYQVSSLIRDQNNNFLFTSDNRGVFRIINEKEILPANNGLPVEMFVWFNDLLISRKTLSVFVTAGDSGLYRSTDNGDSWENVFHNASVNQIIQTGDSLVIGTESGFFSSKDDGDSWNCLISTYGSAFVTSVKSAGNSDVVYSATESGLFKSTDNGNTWNYCESLGNYFIEDIAVNIDNPSSLYVAAGGYSAFGLFKSDDDGESWKNISPVNDESVNRIEISQSGPEVLIASIDNKIWKSTDRGESWKMIFENHYSEPYFVNPLELRIAQSDPEVIYATFEGSFNSMGMFVSTDGGNTWNRRMNGFPGGISENKIGAVAIHPYQPAIAYIGTFSGKIYKTTNFGISWTRLTGGLPEPGFTSLNATSIIIDENFPSIIYAGFSGERNYDLRGIYRSTDDGVTWVQQSLNGMYNNQVTSIAKSSKGSSHNIYAGTYGGGVFKFSSNEILPVELLSFSAKADNFKVNLTWSTGSEKNNLGFAIERKKSGTGKWNEIGFSNGKGTTSDKSFYFFNDSVNSPGLYSYRLQQIDFDGQKQYSDDIEVSIIAQASFSLEQNYPNPFNPETTLRWSIPADGYVTLKIYDINGSQVASLVDEFRTAGNYQTIINVNNLPGGKSLASGIYLYKLTSGSFSESKKLVLLK